MLKFIGCFVEQHDPFLVAWAALIGALASMASVTLLHHARTYTPPRRMRWVAVAAVAGGAGTWSTHFIAMLAYSPGVASGYALATTGLSLAIALVFTFAGFAVAVQQPGRVAPWLGGAIVGAGIGAMHYIGMSAFKIAGRIEWNWSLVALSMAIGTMIASAALATAARRRTVVGELAAGMLFWMAICGLHFTGMSAATIVPDPTIAVSSVMLPGAWVAAGAIAAIVTVMALAGAALLLDVRERRRTVEESERTRSLVNAMSEGLIICADDRIVDSNDNLIRMSGWSMAELVELPVASLIKGDVLRNAINVRADQAIEGELICRNGAVLPVELVIRPVVFARVPRIAVAIRDVSARRKAERQIHFLAHHDALTGLLNRESFNNRLEESLQLVRVNGRKLAVLCLDLDRFKEVNDLFGHPAGDTMLQTVARAVTDAMTEGQIIARIGGDEFAVVAIVDHAANAGSIAERILGAIRSTNGEAQGPMIDTSIGIAIYPTDAADRETLISHADTALYRAKADGRGTYCYFEAKMGAQVRDRRLLEHDLRYAIARNELKVVYQPQSEVETGVISGFEALLRWEHPVRGMVPPSLFVPLAEETGLIMSIGEWVLRETCREAATWEKPLITAVNVSAMQIHNPQFPQLVHEILLESGLPAFRLELEITETALIRDPGRALATLRALKALGLRIAMDDFGTGYSSLSNLRMFPFDKLKIDRSFIAAVNANDQTAAIVRSVLGLGRGLGIPVLAEGVETEDEMLFLRGELCHAVQGYLLSRPAAIETFSDLTGGLPAEVVIAVPAEAA